MAQPPPKDPGNSGAMSECHFERGLCELGQILDGQMIATRLLNGASIDATSSNSGARVTVCTETISHG